MGLRGRATAMALSWMTLAACPSCSTEPDASTETPESELRFRSTVIDRTLPDVDALGYEIDLDVVDDPERETFRAEVKGTFVATRALTELTLDFEGNTIEAVEVSGRAADHRRDGANLVIDLPERIAEGRTFSTRVRYHGKVRQADKSDPNDFAAFGGLMVKQRNTDGRKIFTTLDWPRKARRWLPLRDHPRDGAMVTINATFPARYTVLANGTRTGVTKNPDDTKTWRYEALSPMPVYDFHVSAYDDWKIGEARGASGVPIRTYSYAGSRELAPALYGDIPRVLNFYEATFGKYRWGSLAFIQEPIFGGGMENASVISMDETLFAETDVGEARKTAFHELAHHWSGNLVRYRSWSDFWLSEGFTEYLTARAVGVVDGPEAELEVYRSYLGETIAADRENPHPVRPPGAEVDVLTIFDAIPYQKGALVLRMLEGMLGREVLTTFLRGWFDRHAFQAVTTADFEREVSQAAGRDLAKFFETFVYSGYHPELRVSFQTSGGETTVTVDQLQTKGPDAGFVFPLVVELADASGGRERATIEVAGRSTTARLHPTRTPTALTADPDTHVLGTFSCGQSGGSCKPQYRCVSQGTVSVCVPRDSQAPATTGE